MSTKEEPKEQNNSNDKVAKRWKSIVLSICLIWSGWASGMIIAHGIAIAELRQWQKQRPTFVTTEQQQLSLLNKEKELRDMFSTRIDARFAELVTTQAKMLDKLIDIDKKLAEHLAQSQSKP